MVNRIKYWDTLWLTHSMKHFNTVLFTRNRKLMISKAERIACTRRTRTESIRNGSRGWSGKTATHTENAHSELNSAVDWEAVKGVENRNYEVKFPSFFLKIKRAASFCVRWRLCIDDAGRRWRRASQSRTRIHQPKSVVTVVMENSRKWRFWGWREWRNICIQN